jgi:hypothetical protein
MVLARTMLCRRRMNIHRMAILVVFASSLARAQSGECTTTTTVHCTGDAAPYAVPGAIAPAPQVAPAQVAPPPPPVYPPTYPPLGYYPGMLLDYQKLESDGWKVTQHPDGSLWRERTRSTSSPAVWGSGIALFAAAWLGSGIGSLESHNDLGPVGFVPVFGAWVNAAVESGRGCSDYYYDSSSCDHRAATAGWAIAGIAQATGFTMFLVGLASGPKKVEHQPLVVVPGAVGSGGGLNAIGQF